MITMFCNGVRGYDTDIAIQKAEVRVLDGTGL